jgi:hypothetical protein
MIEHDWKEHVDDEKAKEPNYMWWCVPKLINIPHRVPIAPSKDLGLRLRVNLMLCPDINDKVTCAVNSPQLQYPAGPSRINGHQWTEQHKSISKPWHKSHHIITTYHHISPHITTYHYISLHIISYNYLKRIIFEIFEAMQSMQKHAETCRNMLDLLRLWFIPGRRGRCMVWVANGHWQVVVPINNLRNDSQMTVKCQSNASQTSMTNVDARFVEQ